MPVLAICPHCSKTIVVERVPKVSCSDCGSTFNFVELQKNKLIIDARTEAAELSNAKSFFLNGDFVNARNHFQKALDANKNSYSAQYFVSLCGIYINETKPDFDVIGHIVEMIRNAALTLSRTTVAVSDKHKFIVAMLAETKIIIMRRLNARSDLFNNNIDEYRKATIEDLKQLLNLFKLDGELIMSFSPEVAKALAELADYSVKICYKAVQTVLVGEDLHAPDDSEYKQLTSLCNDFCFFAHSFDSSFDSKEYSPDFTQNYNLNDKILSRLKTFDIMNKASTKKKNTITNIDEYESILKECDKALRFTYLNCYKSMCSRQVRQHAKLFFNGFEMLYRLLLPRVVAVDKKRVEIRVPKFVDIVDYCDMLTRFLVDSYEIDANIGISLHEYYEKLLEIVTTYFVPEFDRLDKSINKIKEIKNDEYYAYQKLLFDCACCCAPALNKYVDFSAETDKTRLKLVKICKRVTDDFLLLSEFRIDELEQSNFYRPILQISTAVTDEIEE